jgi:hypothetical protein
VSSKDAVGAELWATVLVINSHHDEKLFRHSVANDIRETGSGDLPLDHCTIAGVDRGRSRIRPARRPFDRRLYSRDEPIPKTRELLLVPLPGVDEIDLSERVQLEREAHADGATGGAR